jgi:CheY-like chemotaxis protein/HPt (histidine-containing phosphotransfer) domain-containing protein
MPMDTPRILVADDNPPSLRFFAEALALAGFECLQAADGGSAVQLAQAHALDLLLLDARMPGLDGTATLAAIRAGPGASRHAPALATTADADPVQHAMLRAAGFAEVLAKPIAVAALRAALARHLPAATVSDSAGNGMDRRQALRAVGGNRATAAALRELFLRELDDLPRELAGIVQAGDHAALRDRLHRLDASAGFCGAPAVVQATARLRTAAAGTPWPPAALAAFLAICTRVRAEFAAERQRPPESEDA